MNTQKIDPIPSDSADLKKESSIFRRSGNTVFWGILGPASVFLFTFCLLFWGANRLPLTWDEGDSFDRADKILAWFDLLAEPAGQDPFSPSVLQEYWPNTVYLEGHPAGYSFLIAMGKNFASLFGNFFTKADPYRFAPIFFFALAMGIVYRKIGQYFGSGAGIAAVGAILLIPRLFAHAQIGACDSLLISFWIFVWAFFDSALKNFSGSIFWGILLGMALSIKFTAWLVPIPFLCVLFTGLFLGLDRKTFCRILLISFPLSLIVFYLMNPPIWFDPIGGLKTFLYLNLHRNENFNIGIWFLKGYCDLNHPLPWYNAFFWILITVPSGILFLFFYSLLRIPFKGGEKIGFKQEERKGTRITSRGMFFLILLNFLLLPIIRSFPGVPVHDGIRLFIPAFAFLGMMAGVGASECWTSFPSRSAKSLLLRIGLFSILIVSFFNLFWYSPHWLSYCNILIGGPKGARSAGMEITYYWDGLDEETRLKLRPENEEKIPVSKVLFSAFSQKTLDRYRKWGDFPMEVRTVSAGGTLSDPENYRYYVLQLRESGLSPADFLIMRKAKPVFRKEIRSGGIGPWDLSGVYLIEIYDFSDLIRISKE
ncbi:MAG: glycosyltransferase family 39 protein [Planctomycetia bacterium]|nr:glycosyltransferase family 39 protein [Planctomycetia bacterium]